MKMKINIELLTHLRAYVQNGSNFKATALLYGMRTELFTNKVYDEMQYLADFLDIQPVQKISNNPIRYRKGGDLMYPMVEKLGVFEYYVDGPKLLKDKRISFWINEYDKKFYYP
jgi:hypothetical protein